MYHCLKNIEDARGVLNWAGMGLPGAPNLVGLNLEEALNQVTLFIDGVRGRLNETINLFREAFKQYVAPSISEAYREETARTQADVIIPCFLRVLG